MSEPLLKIRNHHSASCGDPPIVGDELSECYIGYFENRFGEQWIFTHDRVTGQAVESKLQRSHPAEMADS